MPAEGSPSRRGSGQAVRIDIPRIDIHHSLTTIGTTGGTLSPAPYELGIYRGNGRVNPGDNGISVIAGHVTYNGPDVLYRLSRLPRGSRFTITYANGGTKNFVTTSSPISIDKNTLQYDQRIWGNSSTPSIAIITCDANSGWSNARHHKNNLVVWAKPA